MATTKLKLRTDRKNIFDNTTVYVQVCINSKVKLYSTGFKIKAEHWDEVNQKVKKTFGYGHERLLAKLNKKKSEIEHIIDHTVMNNLYLTFDYITDELQKIENRIVADIPVKNEGLYELIEDYIRVHSSKHAKATITQKKGSYNKLKLFFGKRIPTLEDINYKFYLEYVDWLLDRDLGNSSVNKQLDYLRTFMTYASKLNLFDITKMKDFEHLPEPEKHKISISKDELKQIWEHKFTNSKLEKIRDLFVFGCATGLRESDFSEIKPENIQIEEFSLISIKPKKKLIIPFNFYSREILEKYNNVLPKYSQQKFNDYLKEVMEEIGIDNQEQVVIYKKGVRTEYVLPKYKMVSSHTARRTFITQSILRGIPTAVIQTITGHTNLRSFQKYIKITDMDKRKEMMKWED